MILADNYIIPDVCWYHNPSLKNEDGQTVERILSDRCMCVPNEWYDELYKNKPLNT